MISYFDSYNFDILLYNKRYNPKIKNKYFEKNINYYTDYDNEDNDCFISRYDETDYDTINDLY